MRHASSPIRGSGMRLAAASAPASPVTASSRDASASRASLRSRRACAPGPEPAGSTPSFFVNLRRNREPSLTMRKRASVRHSGSASTLASGSPPARTQASSSRANPRPSSVRESTSRGIAGAVADRRGDTLGKRLPRLVEHLDDLRAQRVLELHAQRIDRRVGRHLAQPLVALRQHVRDELRDLRCLVVEVGEKRSPVLVAGARRGQRVLRRTQVQHACVVDVSGVRAESRRKRSAPGERRGERVERLHAQAATDAR